MFRSFGRIWNQGQKVFKNFIVLHSEKAKFGIKRGKNEQNTQAFVPTKAGDSSNSLTRVYFTKYHRDSLAAELRRKAAWRFMGNFLNRNTSNLPIFAFVGFALAQNHFGNDSHDEVCEQITKLLKECMSPEEIDDSAPSPSDDLRLDNFVFGDMISKGCDAAVYEARRKVANPNVPDDNGNDVDDDIMILSMSDEDAESLDFVVLEESDIESLNEDYNVISLSDDIIACDVNIDDTTTPEDTQYHVTSRDDQEKKTKMGAQFDLAVKVMFNYCTESNSDDIIRVMVRETVPAKVTYGQDDINIWENGSHVKKKHLPPHPNIVDMAGVFVDELPDLADSMLYFPDALPSRLNPDGFGRNMTMFLVMKRYHQTLEDYLKQSSTLDNDARLLILGQLLEGVVHLGRHGVAHRDLKTNNILLDLDTDDSPGLVIGDFGYCLAEEELGLQIPFPTSDCNRGGNTALMAPEISCASPGRNSILDYSRSDLWAVGALSYEIFGCPNPFYRNSNDAHRLESKKYKESDLPPLSANVPVIVKNLIQLLLSRDPNKRPDPEVAANLVYVLLWGPKEWQMSGGIPSSDEVKNWLLLLVAGVMIKVARLTSRSKLNVNLQLKMNLLERLKINKVMSAVQLLESLC